MKQCEDNGGIYGIYVDNRLVYIGKTTVSFNIRFAQHMRAIKDVKHQEKLYQYLRKKSRAKIDIRVLIPRTGSSYHPNKELTNEELCAMEYVLIKIYKPICNMVYNRS